MKTSFTGSKCKCETQQIAGNAFRARVKHIIHLLGFPWRLRFPYRQMIHTWSMVPGTQGPMSLGMCSVGLKCSRQSSDGSQILLSGSCWGVWQVMRVKCRRTHLTLSPGSIDLVSIGLQRNSADPSHMELAHSLTCELKKKLIVRGGVVL